MSNIGWVGFDFDGCLAHHESGSMALGEPIAPIVALVKQYLAAGYEVRIVTARAGSAHWTVPIQQWCVKHIGQMLTITDRKDYNMVLLYDDRAIAVEHNTGRTAGFLIP